VKAAGAAVTERLLAVVSGCRVSAPVTTEGAVQPPKEDEQQRARAAIVAMEASNHSVRWEQRQNGG
jgi:hypothetical protein